MLEVAKRAEVARTAVLQQCPKGVDSEVIEYLAETAVSLLEDMEDTTDAEEVRSELEGVVGPLFEDADISSKTMIAFCDHVVGAVFGKNGSSSSSGKVASSKKGAKNDASAEAKVDRLLYVPNFLLMYGGSPEPLLRNATLDFVRGRRYGVIGANGTGKTTLMSRIAKRDIAGFPEGLTVVHLRHETILKGISKSVKAREYTRLRNTGETAASDDEIKKALCDVGFVGEVGEEMLGKPVSALSGGWQMRLALAVAIAQKAKLLLLDEPTNHLDHDAVKWLTDFINKTCMSGGQTGETCLIVSHVPDFLNDVCTDIIHFTNDGKLKYHEGNFEAFKVNELKGDEVKAKALLEVDDRGVAALLHDMAPDIMRMVFPNPEKIAGAMYSQNPNPVVLSLQNATFKHKGADAPVLNEVTVDVTLSCRLAITGKNGSGKSTLLELLAGKLTPNVNAFGESVWKNENLRTVFIAQHSDVQLKEFMDCTPLEYIQLRFRKGYDEATCEIVTPRQTKQKLAKVQQLAKRHGKRGKEVEAILSRYYNGTECLYEVKWKDLPPTENTFEKKSRLHCLGVEDMANLLDLRLETAWAGADQRPLSTKEVSQHLQDFGLTEDEANNRKVSMLSSGQKSKLMLAASFWTRPHIVFMDEPTNYLDVETVEALQRGLKAYKGGYIIVSHNEKFIEDVCDEFWLVQNGEVQIWREGDAPPSKQANATKGKGGYFSAANQPVAKGKGKDMGVSKGKGKG
eukprot:gnl/MRDRNA2_/MRDRNA2_94782_c0_seq1.p1 gnl/MRDRNA2_/MRDRNA2_94782_c0~~gnl/MRDRNA2_/MRDRNA2_94782_c0_seq1.p1  ORF type:complete len:740 (+),score=163.75 gnl/MRDRNA2_/MRDRNA2_94782_c0_seq1:69-2288(+)